jgi:hypothetical protein
LHAGALVGDFEQTIKLTIPQWELLRRVVAAFTIVELRGHELAPGRALVNCGLLDNADDPLVPFRRVRPSFEGIARVRNHCRECDKPTSDADGNACCEFQEARDMGWCGSVVTRADCPCFVCRGEEKT